MLLIKSLVVPFVGRPPLSCSRATVAASTAALSFASANASPRDFASTTAASRSSSMSLLRPRSVSSNRSSLSRSASPSTHF